MKLSYKTLLFSVLVSVCIAVVPAHATLLGLDTLLQENPDLFSPNLTANLTVAFSDGVLTVTGATGLYTPPAGGDPLNVTDGGTPPFAGPGTFSLSALISTSGVLESGSLTISGAIDDLTIPLGVLLSGDITAFGYQASTSSESLDFDFLFAVTGGSLAADYGPVGGTLMYGTSFNGSFTSDFTNDGNGLADTRAIPEPSSVLLVVMSLLGLGFARRVALRKC